MSAIHVNSNLHTLLSAPGSYNWPNGYTLLGISTDAEGNPVTSDGNALGHFLLRALSKDYDKFYPSTDKE